MKAENETRRPAYETSDASVASTLVGVGTVLAVIAIGLMVAGFFTRGGPVTRVRSAPEFSFQHGAEESSTLVRDWARQDELVRDHLGTYAWIDRPGAVARIPIERAMELFVSEDARRRGGQP